MPLTSFTFVEMYAHALETASHLLTKGAEHAAGIGITEQAMLDWRLIENMHPLSFQLMVVCNFTRQFPARVAELERPGDISSNLDVAGLQAAIADARAYLAALTPEQFDGRDETLITIPIGGDGGLTPTLPGVRWLAVFATTNIYFHLATAYDILRANGVPIGKMDMFPGGV